MVAIVIRAVHRIGGHILADRWLWLLAALAAIATIAGASFWIPLLAAGLAYPLAKNGRTLAASAVLAVAILTAAVQIATFARPELASVPPDEQEASAALLFWSGLKSGLLTFGGAYTAIPFVRVDTVGRGWLSDATFLDGVGLSNVIPAPLVIFSTFVGWIAGGPPGALAITAGMFLPAFTLPLLVHDHLDSVLENARLHDILAGVAGAVVGLIAATAVDLARTVAAASPDWHAALLIFAVALLVAYRLKGAYAAPLALALGGAAGWLTFV